MKNRFIIPLVFGLATGTYALYYMYKGLKNNSGTSNNSNNNSNNDNNNDDDDSNNNNNDEDLNNSNNDNNNNNNDSNNNNNSNNYDDDGSKNSNNDSNNNSNNDDNKNNSNNYIKNNSNHDSNSNNLNLLNGSDIRDGIQDSNIDTGSDVDGLHNNSNGSSDNINDREFDNQSINGVISVGENKDGNIQGGEEHQIKLSEGTTTRPTATSYEIVLVDDIQFIKEKKKSCNNDAQNIILESNVECYPKADSDDEKLLIIEYNAEGIRDGSQTKYGFILTMYPHHWLSIKKLKIKILKLGDHLFISGGYDNIFTTYQFDPFGKLVNYKLWSQPSFGNGEVKNPIYKEPSNVFGFSSSSSSSKATHFKRPSAKSSSGNSPGTTHFSDSNFSTGSQFSQSPPSPTTSTTTPPSNPYGEPTYSSIPSPFGGAPNSTTTPPTPAAAVTPLTPNSTTSQPKRRRDD